jgi:adenylate kinase
VLGGRKDTRIAVAKKLARRYGFVNVMAREQLADQIAKNTEVGRLVLDNTKRKTLVKDSIMNGLIQSRLSQVDSQMQGFVLEGYPRTEGQAVTLKDTYLQPSLIAVLEEDNATPSEVMKQLSEKHQGVMLKVAGGLSAEQIFEKICFHLENN